MNEVNEKDTKNTEMASLKEREKELNCLYKIEELLRVQNRPIGDVIQGIVDVIPPGWQFPDICQAEIVYKDAVYRSKRFLDIVDTQSAEIVAHDTTVGKIRISYTRKMPTADAGPFLNEEVKLIKTIAARLGQFIFHQKITGIMDTISNEDDSAIEEHSHQEWKMAIELLYKTDQNLMSRISRKMINQLLKSGIDEAQSLLQLYGRDLRSDGYVDEANEPRIKSSRHSMMNLNDQAFNVAQKNLGDEKILHLVQKWINEDKTNLLIKPLLNVHASLTDISDAMQRYQNLKPEGLELSESIAISMRVALIRRFLTDQLSFISVAKHYVEPEHFFDLVERLIYPTGSHGKLGGKSAGLYLGSHVLEKKRNEIPEIGDVKTPKTWYVTSEGLHEFVYYNSLEEFYEQKYKKIEEARRDYPHIVQVFKNSHFPKDMVKGLSMALDDFGKAPIIVRSSSLLEDQLGAAFSGKYRSLFLANQGDKKTRLNALLDAIAEVYASTFSPDPIEYRAERGLIDFNEQMAILIQEVVGSRVGPYYFPAYAGVAFSNNEFRWSPRIKRTDGLLRIVPGLGTRAVDRLADDYPVLVAVSQPGLRVNVTVDELVRYSPKKMDVINLKKNCFETLDIKEFLKEYGAEYPSINRIISVNRNGILQRPMGLTTDFETDDTVVTFDGLIKGSPFAKQVEAIIQTLSSVLGTPVDIEFASDGKNFYLLQCRPQSFSSDEKDVHIPKKVKDEDTLFTADRFISSGSVTDITYIVYVDPDKYGEVAELDDLNEIGRIVGRLNKILPRRQFILMGPGRWGSRGDIKLGVRVTYSDINNTAILIEVARKKGNYVPDLSFGTHFFQDLVEASIRYLPLYPDDEGIKFNQEFLLNSPNIINELLPETTHLADVIRVINVPVVKEGKSLRVLMSADEDHALGMFVEPKS